MTDKELRKLSRLELLELLLEVSKENKELKEKIEALKIGNETAQNIRNLSEATLRVENALKYAADITDSLKNAPAVCIDNYTVAVQSEASTGMLSDREIYRRMLNFFAKNDSKLSVFPADIENDVRMRIKSILDKKN